MPSLSLLTPEFDVAASARSKGERTAERILGAAERLFGERGYAGTSLRDVAEAAGLRIPSLYNHFPGKAQLYAAVLDRSLAPVLEMLDGLLAAPPEQRPAPAAIVARITELLAAHPALPRLLLHETLSGGQRLTPMLRERIAPLFAKAHAVARAREEMRDWPDELLPMLVLALYHAVVGFHTIAPFYEATVGEDLTTPEARALQARFLIRLMESLSSGPPVVPKKAS